MSTRIHIDIEKLLAHVAQIKLAYSIDELSVVTPLSRAYWYKVINSGELPASKAGEKTLALVWDLIAHLSELPQYISADGKEERSKQAASLRAIRHRKQSADDLTKQVDHA